MIGQPVVVRTLRAVERQVPVPLTCLCVYEAAALTVRSKYIPPLSVVMHKHKWTFPLVCGVLGAHVWYYGGL